MKIDVIKTGVDFVTVRVTMKGGMILEERVHKSKTQETVNRFEKKLNEVFNNGN